MYYYLYKITNKVNGKIYIGCHQTSDLKNDDYLGSGVLIKKAIEKYGLENFEKEILFFVDSKDEMFLKESQLVNEDFIKRKDVYNLRLGGHPCDGWKYVNERGLNNSGNQHKTLIDRIKNIPGYREEFCKKISKGLERFYSDNSDFVNPFKGKHHTEETKRKIGEKNSKRQTGDNNSRFGTCWIYSLTEKKSITIKKEQLDSYLKEGWLKGRKVFC